MAGLRTPGEPPAIRTRFENPLIAGAPFSTQAQTCDGFLRPGACPSRPWPQPGESKLVPTPGHRWHAGSIFGAGPRIPLCREKRAQFKALLMLHRRPGRLTIAAAQVGRVLVDMMGSDGELTPSHATLAAKARVHVDTVRRGLRQLQEAGFVGWVKRLVRTGWRTEQTSSAYTLAVPAPTSLFNAFLRRRCKSTTRVKCVSQAKAPPQQAEAPSAIDVSAARDALETRRRVIEQRLRHRRTPL